MTERSSSHLSAMMMALTAFALFATGDAIARSMAHDWPGSALATVRYGAAAIAIGVILARREGKAGFRCTMPFVHLGRGTAIAISGSFFWISLGYMPLADATAVQFTSPVWTAILSALFLGQRIGRMQAGLMLAAFIGVLIVLQPNILALGAVALLPLGSAIGMAALMILNGIAAGSVSVLASQFWLAAIATCVLVPMTLAGHMTGIDRLLVTPPTPLIIAKCLMVAVMGTLGHWLLYRSTLSAPAATIAPMAYVQLLCAVFYGWAAFGAPPTFSMLGGGIVIIVAGWLLIRANIRTAQAVAETGPTPD